jgi:hypothetical protein
LPQPLTDIETVPFDEGCIARNLHTGALCRLNATAGMILDWIVSGRSEAETAGKLAEFYGISPAQAAGDVSTIMQAWRQSGLLNSQNPETPETGEAQMPAAERRPDFQASLDICVTCGGPPVRIRCEEAELAGLLAEVLAPARIQPDTADMPGPKQTFDLTGHDGDFQCWSDGALQWRYEPRPLARRLLLQDVIARSLPVDRLAAILHASAISLDGRAVILAGNSGSGKSTLTAGLAAAGAPLIADDLLPLGSAGEGVWPVPFSISVKEGSWPILSPLFAGFDELKTLTSRGMKVRYLAPAMADTGCPVKPSMVVFPTWSATEPAGTERLSAAEIADGLIETGTDLSDFGDTLAEFAAFASSIAGFRIRYPTLETGIGQIRSLAEA